MTRFDILNGILIFHKKTRLYVRTIVFLGMIKAIVVLG
ncbi:hypothetical protein LEP1GSC036_3783 [Leptospira weilii str. 2006001853]|uniref:Uncharacterized protein n=1 Tax=Leptospira weilii str. 2006001853 TaxID=1001589 RepID=A0A828YZR2_9LEPT|nr:hypothetical protein LEP1GSC036_3783 [Leptospira weilii str. 2006001853]EMJ67216.1 hypothetical protein LEP1GSC051_0716 [Leptospira sp. P2653]